MEWHSDTCGNRGLKYCILRHIAFYSSRTDLENPDARHDRP